MREIHRQRDRERERERERERKKAIGVEERYRGSHRDGKIKRKIGRGERKRDKSGRERENHRKREAWWERER